MTPYREAPGNETEVLERRRRIRHDHDELQQRADQLALEITEATSGGIASSIAGAFGGGTSDEELARKRADLERLEGELAALVVIEREIEAELARAVERRAARSAYDASRLTALRAAEGPVGEQLRAIASERTTTTERVTAFDAALAAMDRASTVVGEIAGVDEAGSASVSAVKAVANVAAVVTGSSLHTGDADARTGRRSSQVELAGPLIREFLDRFEQLSQPWPDPKSVELSVKQLAASSTGAFDTASVRTCLDRLDAILSDERRRLGNALVQLDTREQELLERS